METYSTKIIELDKHDTDFPGFKWVLKAVDFDPGYGLSRIISINPDGIVATDGHRLHIYTPEVTYPMGLFKILVRQRYYLLLGETKDAKFPDYKDVIPDYSKFLKLDTHGVTESAYAVLIKNMPQAVSYKYFADVGYMQTMWVSEKEGQPVIFEDYHKKALIMPMRI